VQKNRRKKRKMSQKMETLLIVRLLPSENILLPVLSSEF